jgi:hypothetical protein
MDSDRATDYAFAVRRATERLHAAHARVRAAESAGDFLTPSERRAAVADWRAAIDAHAAATAAERAAARSS